MKKSKAKRERERERVSEEDKNPVIVNAGKHMLSMYDKVYLLGAKHGSMLCADDPWITLCLCNPGIVLAVHRWSF